MRWRKLKARFHVRLSHISGTVLCCAAVLAADAAERVFYKSVMPGGRAVYSDSPVAGAKRTEQISVQTDTLGSAAEAEAARRGLAMRAQQLLRDAEARAAKRAELGVRISAAYEKLVTAQAQLEAGRAVGEGDRQGRRLTSSYWERQRRLEATAARARSALEAVLAERDALG